MSRPRLHKSADATRRELRNALGTFATGVTIVTARKPDGTPFGMTANSFASVSLEPPMVSWCVAHDAWCCADFIATEHFAIHVLKDSQRELSETFAAKDRDKFASVPWTEGPHSLPLLDECVSCFVCRVAQRIEAGDHTILLAQIESLDVHSHERPLIFHRGLYASLQ